MADENETMDEKPNTESHQENQKSQNQTSEGAVFNINGKSEMEDLRQQAEKAKNDYLYLRAEFENYKKNAIRERSELSKYGSERVLNEVISVIDNFERALDLHVTPENLSTYVQGVKMTANELKSVVQKFGVVEIPALGLPFDPILHEALGTEETSDVKEGYVLKVFKKAYKLHDRVIRPAQVIVAKAVSKN